ncbi:MAG: antitoxin Xre/MbcA/ParS toxin-binding domain-containing protein [Pseudomonadota bacterium]
MTGMQDIGELLGGRKCLGRALRTTTDMDALIREGLPVACASQMQSSLALPDRSLADLLALGTRTLVRLRQDNKRLSLAAGDRLFRLARIFSLATEVLEDQQAARRWLLAPQAGLGGQRPLDLMLTEAGSRQVEELLGRIEYGVLA